MAGMHAIKTGTSTKSWFYYVTDKSWTKRNDLVTDTPGTLYSADFKTPILEFEAETPLQILSICANTFKHITRAYVSIKGKDGWVNIRHIRKPQLGNRILKTRSQREVQERFVIRTINKYASKTTPITVTGSSGFEIVQVVSAKKYSGYNRAGKQQYADIILTDSSNKQILISMKEFDAPSLFGGGLDQLKEAGLDYLRTITRKAWLATKKDKRFKINTTRRVDIYIRLRNRAWIKKAIIGSKQYGGPCDYIFIGPKEPTVDFTDGVLTFGVEGQGQSRTARFYSPDELMEKIPSPYLRIRSRGEDAKNNVTSKPIYVDHVDQDGIPLFWIKKFGSSERARFVVAIKAQAKSNQYLTIDG